MAREADYEIASMDDEGKFGSVLHKLTFGEAIDRDLLSDYRVLVVGVDQETYRRYVDQRELVTFDRETVTDAGLLASHIGLAKAMRKYDLRRVVSFHGRVKRAQRFSSLFPGILAWMPADERPDGRVWSEYVSGEMSSGRRDTLLAQLRSLDGWSRGLLSNARCLSEGVDLPTLNGVAFIDPRSSRVDIIQAIGRAIRKSPDKSLGFIVLPVFISGADDPEQAMQSSMFKDVWDVLNALRAHDELLAEELDMLRRQLATQGRSDLRRPAKIVLEVPEGVGEDFARAFDVRLVESVTSSWEFMFGLLERFVKSEGHIRVPQGHVTEDGFPLGTWVTHQRQFHKSGILGPDRVRKLEGLEPWIWDPHTGQWEKGFASLSRFAANRGHTRVPKDYVDESRFKLGIWVANRRKSHKNGKLAPGRVRQLEALPGGWSSEPFVDQWEEGFDRLSGFVKREGHSLVLRPHVDDDGFRLGQWVGVQRSKYHSGKLAPDRVRRLQELTGWSWDALEAKWEEALVRLRRFVAKHGHSRVPQGYVDEDRFQLGTWVQHRRQFYKGGKLSDDRIRSLEALPGWVWDGRGKRGGAE